MAEAGVPALKTGTCRDDGVRMAVHRSGGAIVLGSGRVRRPRRRSGNLVELLAQGAAPLQERLAERLDLPGGLRDRDHYRSLLAALLRAWEPIEAALASCEAYAALGLAPTPVAEPLRADLAALGEVPPADPARQVRMGRPEGVGTIYVLEGTAAGGPMLAQLIERHLSLESGVATRYLRGAGPRAARRWASARRAIDAWGRGCTGAEADRAVWAAQLTLAITGAAMAGALGEDAAAAG